VTIPSEKSECIQFEVGYGRVQSDSSALECLAVSWISKDWLAERVQLDLSAQKFRSKNSLLWLLVFHPQACGVLRHVHHSILPLTGLTSLKVLKFV
jgi:hypothetical protein